MGFNGGGGGQLLNHEHDGTLVADGGPLDFKNITQSGMSAGSITQSDGAHLQELVIGNPSDTIRVNGAGTAIEYTNVGMGTLELLASQTLAATGPTLTVSGLWLTTDYAYYIIEGGFSNDNSVGTPSLEMQLNGSSLANYHTNMILNTAGVLSATTSGIATSGTICTSNVCPPSSTETCQTTITLELSVQPATPTYRWNWSNTWMWDQGGIVPSDTEQICGIFGNNSVTQLSEVKFFFSDSSNFRIGSNIFLYGVKRN